MTVYEINERFIHVTAGERPTDYPTNTVLLDEDTKLFYQWNGTVWNRMLLIEDNDITTAKIANSAVTSLKIADGTIVEGDLNSSMLQLIRGPVRGKKIGSYYGTSLSTVSGMLNGTTFSVGTAVGALIDTTYGSYYRRRTDATSGTNTGLHTGFLTIRKFNPIYATMLRPSIVENNRIYGGFISEAFYVPASGTEDPLANEQGVMLLQRSTDTQYQICSNNGSATSTIVTTGIDVSTTIPITIIIRADDTNSKWQWSVNGGSSWTDVTGNFPDQTTVLCMATILQTAEAVQHQLHPFAIEIVSDK